MADKEATVYIVDLGASMAKTHGGRSVSDLDWAMQYVWDKICATVAASRKTWKVGVLGLRTDETRNAQQDDEGYDHIAVLHDIDAMSLAAMRSVGAQIQPSRTVDGDAVSAIIVAVMMITAAAPARLKFHRKIVLVTDGRGAVDEDDLDDIARRINELGIQLVVMYVDACGERRGGAARATNTSPLPPSSGVDFDDAAYGFKEEEKSKTKVTPPPDPARLAAWRLVCIDPNPLPRDARQAENEKLLRTLVDKCNGGVFGTLAEAIEETQRPSVKPTRPYKTYDGPLTLGDPKTFDGALSIGIERYFLTKKAIPPSASTVVVRPEPPEGATQSTHTLDDAGDVAMGDDVAFSAVRSERVYTVDDPARIGGKREVPFEELEKGYEYGRTAVYISNTDANITQLQTEKDFSILGFITRANVSRALLSPVRGDGREREREREND